jgi:chromosome segregation ATPase
MITKQNIKQISSFITQLPDVQITLKFLVVNYLKFLNENENLKSEISDLKKENDDLLTELADRDRMVQELEAELEITKTIH